MPMLTMSVKRSPFAAFVAPDRTLLREAQHLLALALDLGPEVHAADENRPVGKIAKRHMHGRARFRVVDGLARKQRVATRLQVARACERHEQPHRLDRDLVLGEIEKEAVHLEREFPEAAWIAREKIARAKRLESGGVGFQGGERFAKGHGFSDSPEDRFAPEKQNCATSARR